MDFLCTIKQSVDSEIVPIDLVDGEIELFNCVLCQFQRDVRPPGPGEPPHGVKNYRYLVGPCLDPPPIEVFYARGVVKSFAESGVDGLIIEVAHAVEGEAGLGIGGHDGSAHINRAASSFQNVSTRLEGAALRPIRAGSSAGRSPSPCSREPGTLRLDEMLARSYAVAVDKLAGAGACLRVDQTRWLRTMRIACPDDACLQRTYRLRPKPMTAEGRLKEEGGGYVPTARNSGHRAAIPGQNVFEPRTAFLVYHLPS